MTEELAYDGGDLGGSPVSEGEGGRGVENESRDTYHWRQVKEGYGPPVITIAFWWGRLEEESEGGVQADCPHKGEHVEDYMAARSARGEMARDCGGDTHDRGLGSAGETPSHPVL